MQTLQGLPVIVTIVLGLTQWIKTRLHLQDKAAEILAFIVGFLLGAAYQYVLLPPVTAQGWLAIVVVGLGMALVPSGLYKFVMKIRDGNGVKPTLHK